MPEYRFYKINMAGHIAGPPHLIECPDDLAAIKEANKLLDGDDIEIWKGHHIVSYLTAKGLVKPT
jgi:hypothetical protein